MQMNGATARGHARSARFEEGRLTTETFDGELDRAVFERMVGDAQRLFAAQAALWFKALGLLVPPRSDHRD